MINLLGPRETFLASVFSSQKNTGDVCDARPAERRAIFTRMLGLEHLDKISQAAKERAGEIRNSIDATQGQIEILQKNVNAGAGAADELANVQLEISRTNSAIELLKVEISAIEDRIRAEEEAAKKETATKDKYANLQAELVKLKDDLEKSREEYQRLKKRSENLPDLEKKKSGLDLLKKERLGIEKAISGINQSLMAVQGEYEKKKADAYSAISKAESNWKVMKHELDTSKDKVSDLEKRAALLKSTPDVEACKKCLLVKSAMEARDQKIGAEAKVKEVSGSWGQSDIDLIKARSAYDKVLAEPDPTAAMKEELGKYKSQLTTIDREINQNNSVESDIGSARAAVEGLAAAIESGKRKKEIIEQKEKEVNVAKTEVDKLAAKGSGVDRSKYQAKKGDLILNERNIAELNQRHGSIAAKITSAAEAEADIQKLNEKSADAQLSIKDLDLIAEAFGKTGIQPLIIDQARPELEEIADDLLGKATGGRMRVRFETQKSLKSGDKAESLDIVISRDGIDMEVGELSGGEQKLVRTAVRMTLAVWQSRRGGSRLRTLFIDEIADALDDENSSRMVELLKSLQDHFDRILVISHDDELLEELPGRLNFKKGPSGVEVEVIA
jgi:exonuclease SbcC